MFQEKCSLRRKPSLIQEVIIAGHHFILHLVEAMLMCLESCFDTRISLSSPRRTMARQHFIVQHRSVEKVAGTQGPNVQFMIKLFEETIKLILQWNHKLKTINI